MKDKNKKDNNVEDNRNLTHQLQDRLYSEPRNMVADFTFDEQVASVFADMIQRSVPGYGDIVSMIGILAERYAAEDSVCYDLGCSLGAGTLAMNQRISANNCRIVAVDKSIAMIERCKTNIIPHCGNVPVDMVCADVRDVLIQQASVVVLNLVLQFIPVSDRRDVLTTIYNGLLPGGLLILSEKIKFDDSTEEQFQTEMYHAFKKSNGYSDLEINQKRTALENVLVLDTQTAHLARLKQIGFSRCYPWFQCFNFISVVAFK